MILQILEVSMMYLSEFAGVLRTAKSVLIKVVKVLKAAYTSPTSQMYPQPHTLRDIWP